MFEQTFKLARFDGRVNYGIGHHQNDLLAECDPQTSKKPVAGFIRSVVGVQVSNALRDE